MDPTRHSPSLAALTGALALALLALPASAEDIGLNRNAIPDASLRNIRHVVCASFYEGAEHSLPVYERKGDGSFHTTGTLQRDRTAPVSRSKGIGWTDDCYPATQAVPAEGRTRYAEVIIDVYTGRKVWLRAAGETENVPITIDSLETLEAFKDRHIDFYALRRRGQPLVLRKGPEDSAAKVMDDLPPDIVVRRRQGDFVELQACDPSLETCKTLGWVRLVDPSGLLLLWPSPSETHEC